MIRMLTGKIARFGGVATLLAGGVLAASPTTVSAYGTVHLYEITLSYNCMNAALCAPTPFGIGGLWGWIEPDSGGMVDGALQFQGHQNANPALNGTGHTIGFQGWSVISCPGAPDCALLDPEQTPPDPSGRYFDILADFNTIGVLPVLVPATPGKYSVHSAPGVFSEATVTALG
jgi:hypothetical protein